MTKVTLAAVVCFGALVTAQGRSVWDGVYTEAQAVRGERVYTQSCASCHGADLAGTVVDPQQRRRNTPPLTGEWFLQNWNGLPLEALFTRNRISMPQEAPGSLSAAKNADLLAYLLQKNGMPAGVTELPPQVDVLKQIAFTAKRP